MPTGAQDPLPSSRVVSYSWPWAGTELVVASGDHERQGCAEPVDAPPPPTKLPCCPHGGIW